MLAGMVSRIRRFRSAGLDPFRNCAYKYCPLWCKARPVLSLARSCGRFSFLLFWFGLFSHPWLMMAYVNTIAKSDRQ